MLLRFMVAIASWLCAGLGFFWSLFDKQKRTWHDIYSNTHVGADPEKDQIISVTAKPLWE